MTKKKKYKRIEPYVTRFPGLGECEVRGESLKDGNLIVYTTDEYSGHVRKDSMFVVTEGHVCHACGSISFRKYRPALDGEE